MTTVSMICLNLVGCADTAMYKMLTKLINESLQHTYIYEIQFTGEFNVNIKSSWNMMEVSYRYKLKIYA